MQQLNDTNAVFTLGRDAEGVWMNHVQLGPVFLGKYDDATDELCRFITVEEFGEPAPFAGMPTNATH
jgi:hypothetical protein